MADKQVAIAKHLFFYKVFFNKHKEFLENLSQLEFINLNLGFQKLNVFYGSYSYYLKDDDRDTYLRDMINEKQTALKNNKRYFELRAKLNSYELKDLTFDDLCELNLLNHEYLKEILEIYEIFCNRFAPNDIFPQLTENIKDHDKNFIWIVYDAFYESLFKIHELVHDKLMNFNVLNFQDIFKMIMVFFYGYSYYLLNETKKQIKDELKVLYSYYNNQEFLIAYYGLLTGQISNESLKLLKDYETKFFQQCISIYEKINNDLPKGNLFPKRTERISVDLTLM